jgi:hypothetical protein
MQLLLPSQTGQANLQKFSEQSKESVRFEVFTAMTMKYAVFWDIEIQFVPHRKRVISPLQSLAVNTM